MATQCPSRSASRGARLHASSERQPSRRPARDLLAIFGAIVVLLAACGLIPSEVDVPLEYPLIVAGGLASVTPAPLPGVGSTVRQTISGEGVPIDRVEAVRVSEMQLAHLSPPSCPARLEGCDLAFLEELELLIESPGMEPVTLGRLRDPGRVRLATMEFSDVDLLPFIEAGEASVTARVALARPPLETAEMEVRVVLTAEIDVF